MLTVYAMYLDLDRAGNQLQGVVLTSKEAIDLCKKNPYLSWREKKALLVGDDYIFVEESARLLKK